MVSEMEPLLLGLSIMTTIVAKGMDELLKAYGREKTKEED
tara:strand:- start:467 stop:586 length:120 start_codon:yes stop_codon:yes gene_type:complete